MVQENLLNFDRLTDLLGTQSTAYSASLNSQSDVIDAIYVGLMLESYISDTVYHRQLLSIL